MKARICGKIYGKNFGKMYGKKYCNNSKKGLGQELCSKAATLAPTTRQDLQSQSVRICKVIVRKDVQSYSP